MKRIYTIISLVLFALCAFANEYTDKLTVTVNGESVEQQATISISKGEDGKYTLSLNNFCLESLEEDGTVSRMGVGNIILADIEGTTVDGITSITYNDGINITAGDDPYIFYWLGPALSEMAPVPIEMNARFNDTQLYCEIHINLEEMLGQVIDVVFGTEPTTNIGCIKSVGGASIFQKDKSVYDLQGRKTTSIRNNTLYIVNGKKIVIRR